METQHSQAHWETPGRVVPQHSFIWWRTGQAWPWTRQNCLVVERVENACTGICLQGHSNPDLIWICANVLANTTLQLLHSVAQNCLCLKTKDNQNHFLFRCVSISRTRGVSQSLTQSVKQMAISKTEYQCLWGNIDRSLDFQRGICTIFSQYLHNIFPIFAIYFPNICTTFVQYFHNICPIFAQYFPICSQYLPNIAQYVPYI